MATGDSKKNWEEKTQIISDEIFNESFEFKISYDGKIPKEKLISETPKEVYSPIFNKNSDNKFFYGDNLDVLKHLLHNLDLKKRFKLIYIDPPYGTNSIFFSRNQKSSYRDDLIGSHYIEFIRKRLILLRELLSDDGSIYVHLDNNMVFEIKLIMDEIFGPQNFRGLITRKKCSTKNYTKKTYGNISDYIIFYSKSDNYTWERATIPWSDEKIKKEYPCIDEKTGKRYKKVPIHAPGTRNGETGKEWKGMLPPKGKHWQYTPKKLDELDANGEIYWSANGNPRRKVFFDKDSGIPIQDIWMDVQDSVNQNIKITGYPTEKNPLLIERIINASSNEGDYILDCFSGSGTTLDIANQLKRKWVGIDNSFEAIQNTFKRFFCGLEPMGNFTSKKSNANKKVATLFELPSISNENSHESIDFNFYADKRYENEATDLYESFTKK